MPAEAGRKRGRPSGKAAAKVFPVVSTGEMLAMGFSRPDIARLLRQGGLKPHAWGRYQTTMPLADYRNLLPPSRDL
ncbi:MAG TPA: hypothetical protein PLM07_16845 [Candidatus Rifleibacterium sp.]|nr:hypothetical protein [Candidatus Rifleibacterium sp.]